MSSSPDEFAELGIIQTHQDVCILPDTTDKVTQLDEEVECLGSGDGAVPLPGHGVLFQTDSVRGRLVLQRYTTLIITYPYP